jgi:hypothetical protein
MLICKPPQGKLCEVHMPYNRNFRILTLLFVGTCFFALHVAAQDAPSVAEAARRTRQQKEAASKPAQVVTNDTLPPAPANVPPEAKTPGAPAQAESAASAAPESATEAEKAPSSGATAQNPEQLKKEVETLKQQIADKQRAVNDLQREVALEQDIVYRNPDYQRDTAGKQKLDSLQSDLKQNQDDLAALKAKLADLGGDADRASFQDEGRAGGVRRNRRPACRGDLRPVGKSACHSRGRRAS